MLSQLKLIYKLLGSFSTSIVPNKASTHLLEYLKPYKNLLTEIPNIPKLQIKSQKYLMENWWSERPFNLENQSRMQIPVFNFENQQFINKSVELPQDIFNHPLRRDLMHRLYDYRINLNKFTTKMTRNRAMTAGSGIKMRQQKGSGKARMGDKRAPHLKKGGKAHGSKPKVYSYPLNGKIKLKALKALLTSKLVEGKIRIIDSEKILQPKTKILSKILKNYQKDNRILFCIVTSKICDQNFHFAQKNIPGLIWHTSQDIDVLTLFKVDKILITLKGLEQLIDNIYKTTYVLFRPPHLPKLKQQEITSQPQQQFNPDKPYQYKFKLLAEYLQRYNKLKDEDPEFIKMELQRVNKQIK